MRVLSLFDGISCGRVALERAGIPVEKYYASEIDKYAIQITQKNYPDTVQLGDVTKINFEELIGKIDLLIGGSPCQGFSFAGKQLNFSDPRSKLFFEYVRAINTIKPKYFLLENVKMKQEYQDIISDLLGVKPIEINSSLVSAQNRKRLYWTNIPVGALVDQGILLKDIVHEYKDGYTPDMLSSYIVPFDKTLQIIDKELCRGKIGYFRKDSQANRVYSIHGKAVTLCGEAGGGAAKMGQYLFGHTKKNSQGDRVYTEQEKSACLNASSGGTAGSGNILFGCITPDRIEKKQNGQRFNARDKFYTLTAQDRHGVFIDGYIRKLTPIECERLQTLPDNYTDGIPNPQRYKCLGNGWTVDVIVHIFKGLKPFADSIFRLTA